jgi:hypothetical protein
VRVARLWTPAVHSRLYSICLSGIERWLLNLKILFWSRIELIFFYQFTARLRLFWSIWRIWDGVFLKSFNWTDKLLIRDEFRFLKKNKYIYIFGRRICDYLTDKVLFLRCEARQWPVKVLGHSVNDVRRWIL